MTVVIINGETVKKLSSSLSPLHPLDIDLPQYFPQPPVLSALQPIAFHLSNVIGHRVGGLPQLLISSYIPGGFNQMLIKKY